MKNLIYILLFLFTTPAITNSKCMEGGVFIWPSSKQISSNSIFVFNTHGIMIDFMKDSLQKYPIYLESNKDTVKLNVIKVYDGDLNFSQFILKPEKQLTTNITYSLDVRNFEKERYYLFFLNTGIINEDKNYSWEIKKQFEINPTKLDSIEFSENIYWVPGCGPVAYTKFKILDELPDLLITATVVTENETRTSILNIKDSEIKVGHDMCLGPFNLSRSEIYNVSFQLIDYSGKIKSNKFEINDIESPYFLDATTRIEFMYK